MKERVTVKFKGIELEIVGNYFKGDAETRDYPGSDSYFELDEVFHGGENIFDLFSWEDIDVMNELAIKKIED